MLTCYTDTNYILLETNTYVSQTQVKDVGAKNCLVWEDNN